MKSLGIGIIFLNSLQTIGLKRKCLECTGHNSSSKLSYLYIYVTFIVPEIDLIVKCPVTSLKYTYIGIFYFCYIFLNHINKYDSSH